MMSERVRRVGGVGGHCLYCIVLYCIVSYMYCYCIVTVLLLYIDIDIYI